MSYRGEVVYFNGLERTHKRLPEKVLSFYLRLRGIKFTHAEVDWHSDKSFDELFDTATDLVKGKLKAGGRLAIVGASAGGSMGVNVFQRLRQDDPSVDVTLTTLSGWLKDTNPNRLDYVALHGSRRQNSYSVAESVRRSAQAIPLLADEDMSRALTTYPFSDEIVPLDSMNIDGVESYQIPRRGHLSGIVAALLILPRLLDRIPAEET